MESGQQTNGINRPRFGKSQPHRVTLPSGYKALAQRPSTFSLIASGGFPSELSSLVWTLFNAEKKPSELLADSESLKKYALMLETFTPHVLVSPEIIKTGTSDCKIDEDGIMRGTLLISEVPDADKQWLVFFGMGIHKSDDEIEAAAKEVGERMAKGSEEATVEDLKPFRDEPARDDAGQPREEIREATIGDGRVAAEQSASA